METRINAFGENEVKIQPDGLPAIWIKLCKRCGQFQECLGFNNLSEAEWQEINNLISSVNLPPVLIKEAVFKNIKSAIPNCSLSV